MRIYEIDREIEALLDQIDEETGEVLFDPELLEELQMERERKVENLALAWKNLAAEAKAIKAEEEALAKRRKATENEAERARKYLEYVLGGEGYTVEIGPEFVPWAFEHRQNLLRMKEPEADKTAIKAALKAGEEIPFTELAQKKSMTIK